MKIAIANDEGYVSSHFGHCAEYVLFTVEDGKVTSRVAVPTPPHEPGALPRFLADLAVDCVIAGGMGMRAQQNFEAQGIEVILGVQGQIDQVLTSYLSGELAGGKSTCSHGESACGS